MVDDGRPQGVPPIFDLFTGTEALHMVNDGRPQGAPPPSAQPPSLL